MRDFLRGLLKILLSPIYAILIVIILIQLVGGKTNWEENVVTKLDDFIDSLF